MMPNVTEWLRPKGLPTASTKSPISIRSLSPTGEAIRSAASIGQHADVGLFVLQHPLRMKLPAVGQIDADAVGRGVAKDVPVGEHVEAALPLDDHSRAGFLECRSRLCSSVCCGTSASIWTTVGPMSLATVLRTVAWASRTAAFCSRIRCNWARASGDVTGRWLLTGLIFAALAGETPSVSDAQQTADRPRRRPPRPAPATTFGVSTSPLAVLCSASSSWQSLRKRPTRCR